jgi:hypothetical protein
MKNAPKHPTVDHPDVDPEEMIEASDERNSALTPPEVPAGLESAVEWDTPATSSGSAAPKVGMEDEGSIAEQLILEGVDEAEREQRMAAADPDLDSE